MEQQNQQKILRRMIFLAALLIVIFLVYIVSLSASRSGKTKVSLRVIPDDAKVLINNEPASAGDIYLSPGSHTFSAEKTGFKKDIQIVDLGEEPLVVGLTPAPVSEEAIGWLEDNPDIQQEREELGSINAARKSDEISKTTPIISALPYQDIYGPFKVDYGASDISKNGIFLEISSSTPPGRVKAIEWIRQQGYDPTDLEIRYFDFVNPLITGNLQ